METVDQFEESAPLDAPGVASEDLGDMGQGVGGAAGAVFSADMTERERTEESLSDALACARKVLEVSPVGVAVYDGSGRCIEANEAGARILGTTREWLLQKDFRQIASWKESGLLDAAEVALASGATQERQVYLVSTFGKGVWLACVLTSFRSDGQQNLLVMFHDLTEYKRAEEALRQREQELNTLIENLPCGVFVKDRAGRYTKVNHVYATMGHLRAADLLGKTVYDLVSKEIADRWQAEDDELLSSGQAQAFEQHWPWGVSAEVRKVPLRDASGTVVGLLGTALDITGRKEAEAALQSERDFNASLVNTARVIMLVLDTEGRIISYNPYMEELTGYKLEQVRGRDWFSTFLPERDRERIRTVFLGAVAGSHVHGNVNAIVTADGRECEVEWRSDTLRDGDGRITGVLAIGQDVTEQRGAGQALAQEQSLVNTVLETIPDHIYFKDLEGRFLRINRSLAEYFGLNDPSQAIGKTDYDFFGPEHAGQAYVDEQEVMHSGQPEVAQEEKEVWPDGRETWVSTTKIALRDGRGQVIGTFGISRDITERKRLEAQFLQAQKMESVGRLAGGVAHDFNNLLTVINLNTTFAHQDLPREHPVQEYLGDVLKAADSAANLTRQLLAFSRRQIIEPKVLDLNALIKNTQKMLHRLIGEDIEVVKLASPDLGLVEADVGQIEQVLLNLAVNARDAMPQGGKLTIKTANATLDGGYVRQHLGAVAGQYVMFSVSDTGTGMSDEIKRHLFEPFFSTKDVGKGTGLGLATVYGIVKQHHGYIWVDSEPGEGATFTVYLPRIERVVERTPESETVGDTLQGGETILMVDDDLAVRAVMARMLSQLGYNVLLAANGLEGLRTAQKHRGKIDLLLTDVVMPQMGGKPLADAFRSLQPDAAVLYITGYTDDAIVDHGVLNPGVVLLQKPFTAGVLARKVREVLNRQRVTAGRGG